VNSIGFDPSHSQREIFFRVRVPIQSLGTINNMAEKVARFHAPLRLFGVQHQDGYGGAARVRAGRAQLGDGDYECSSSASSAMGRMAVLLEIRPHALVRQLSTVPAKCIQGGSVNNSLTASEFRKGS
jgi:hypothetical protein